MLTEEWKAVLDSYLQVSSLGNVRSWARKGQRSEITSLAEKTWRPVTPWPNTRGYLMVGWYWKQKRYASLVHRLVLTLHSGTCPDGMEARHLNGVLTDNRLENLAWGSQGDNLRDQRRHGTCIWKLDFEKAREIRIRHSEGERAASLARAYGVSPAAIAAVLAGRTYRP